LKAGLEEKRVSVGLNTVDAVGTSQHGRTVSLANACPPLSSAVRILETEGSFPISEYLCESWRTARHHLEKFCPMGIGYKASSSLTAHVTWENTYVLSQAVLTGFASGL